MSDMPNSDGATADTAMDLDAVLGFLAPVAEFVSPYIDAVVDAAPEARVHLFASARELCLAAEVFLGALEDAARSAAEQQAADRVTVVPDVDTGVEPPASSDVDARTA